MALPTGWLLLREKYSIVKNPATGNLELVVEQDYRDATRYAFGVGRKPLPPGTLAASQLDAAIALAEASVPPT